MTIDTNVFRMCLMIILSVIASQQMPAADLKKTSNDLGFTDLVQVGEDKNARFLFCFNEIDELIKSYGKAVRLPNQREAEEMCKALDEVHLAEVYGRDDFPVFYQDFFIVNDASSEPLAFCPTSKNNKTRKLGGDDKCCVRFVIECQTDSREIYNSDWYKILCSSTDLVWSKCTWQNVYHVGYAAVICYGIYQYVVNPGGAPPASVRNVKERVVQVYYFARDKLADLVKQGSLPQVCNGCL